MPPFLPTLLALDAKATPGPLAYSPRRDDRPVDAPGSIISGAETGRAVAVAVSPQYCRGQFKNDAALFVLLRNHAARLAAVVEAAGAVVASWYGAPGCSPNPDESHAALRAALAALEAP